MSHNKEIVVFENRDGHKLFGTLHLPSEINTDYPIVVLLSPGIKMRVGPHRLYNRITLALNDLGFTVFKFDFFGLGDSEGEIEHRFLHEVYRDTETGRFVNDSLDALDWLESNRGANEFLLAGLCGGAITGLLLAQNDPRVKGLVSLAMTVTLSSGPGERVKYASQDELASLGEGYLRNLLSPKSWLRLLTFQSDFSTIKKSIVRLGKCKSKAAPSTDAKPTENDSNLSNANPRFPLAFFSIAESRRKMLFVYSKSDRTYWDYEEKFASQYSARLNALSESFELHVIDKANHVFSFRIWEREMLDIVSDWLTRHFCST